MPPTTPRPLRRVLAQTFLKLTGWDYDNGPPPLERYVLLCAPHTSTWDFFLLMAAAGLHGIPLEWMGKDSLFRGPLGGLMRKLGGIPIDRSRRTGAVEQAVEQFTRRSALVLAIAPEATRKRAPGWRTGFWHIAHQAGVPIVPSFVDGRRRRGGFGEPIFTSGDLQVDMERIREFYAGITPIHPERFGPVVALPERTTQSKR